MPGDQFIRTRILFGDEGMERLKRARVIVFGLGGVGGCVVEALARSGVGQLDLVDDDRVSVSNLNRQILSLHSTLGMYKADAARDRVLDIDPEAQVRVYKTFFLPETADQFDFAQYDYVVDAIDTVAGKLALAERAQAAGVPIISSMGAGNKVDPTQFRVSDIYETSMDPLARIMRKELRKRGVKSLKVVWSTEQPTRPLGKPQTDEVSEAEPDRGKAPSRRDTPGSSAFVPTVAGFIIASEVIRDLTGFKPVY